MRRPALWFNPLVRGFVGGAAAAVLAISAAAGCQGGRSEPAAGAVPRFVADAGGIDHRYEGDFDYFVGGGVAAFDCDDDGRSELFFAGGSAPAALYRNESPIGGALRFTRLASPVTDLSAVTGAYPIDIDGDGLTDLAVLRVGQDVMLRGLGGCRFERADEALGVDGGDTRTAAFSATWEGADTLPTLAFGGYLAPDRDVVRRTTGCCAPSRPATGTPRRSPWHRATARCRCCSATGVGRADATCA